MNCNQTYTLLVVDQLDMMPSQQPFIQVDIDRPAQSVVINDEQVAPRNMPFINCFIGRKRKLYY